MESSGSASEGIRTGISRRYGMPFASSLLPAPISAILEFSGLIRGRSHYAEVENQPSSGSSNGDSERNGDSGAEVSIRIIGEQDGSRGSQGSANSHGRNSSESGASTSQVPLSSLLPTMRIPPADNGSNSLHSPRSPNTEERGEVSENGNTGTGREVGGQRYDFQQLARWIEQALPFTILLLMVFIRQHLHGFFVTFWISAVMIKANDLLRKQTALKGERKTIVLVAIALVMISHIVGVYWWYSGDALWRPLVIILPPREIPRFWHAIFIIVVNDTMVRLSAMVLKIGLLLYYKNSRGRNYRRQAQLLTLVEYILLLYRALIPGPVWYRFFLNKEYGNLFSSLTTGLYLTFKLTSTYEKVQTFIAALCALSRREVQYGAYATSEEVLAAGDMCAICQEKMHAPISLRCKHIFCEDCVSEWFERERTCPLCRAVVKSAGLRSFGDGSTSLFIQIF
ncbi:E3 ubiquitin-protein ligase RNFT1 [Marchantia polymorpha subsp. ruderalis]